MEVLTFRMIDCFIEGKVEKRYKEPDYPRLYLSGGVCVCVWIYCHSYCDRPGDRKGDTQKGKYDIYIYIYIYQCVSLSLSRVCVCVRCRRDRYRTLAACTKMITSKLTLIM